MYRHFSYLHFLYKTLHLQGKDSILKETDSQFEDGWATLHQGLSRTERSIIAVHISVLLVVTQVTEILHQQEAQLQLASLRQGCHSATWCCCIPFGCSQATLMCFWPVIMLACWCQKGVKRLSPSGFHGIRIRVFDFWLFFCLGMVTGIFQQWKVKFR